MSFTTTEEYFDHLAHLESTGIITNKTVEQLKNQALQAQYEVNVLKKEIAQPPLPPQAPNTDISCWEDFLRKEGEDRLYSWKPNYRRTMETVKLHRLRAQKEYGQETFNEMKENYLSKVKINMLKPWEIMVGRILFNNDDIETAAIRLAQFLYGMRREERLTVANWETFDTFSQNAQLSLGHIVNKLKVPLLLPKECKEINDIILSENTHYLEGGAINDNDGCGLPLTDQIKGKTLTTDNINRSRKESECVDWEEESFNDEYETTFNNLNENKLLSCNCKSINNICTEIEESVKNNNNSNNNNNIHNCRFKESSPFIYDTTLGGKDMTSRKNNKTNFMNIENGKTLTGGNFNVGKTNNVELDELISTYFPSKCIFPCNCLINFSYDEVEHIKHSLVSGKQFYIPIYCFGHWIAGVVERPRDDYYMIKIYDSSPNMYVHNKLKEIFHRTWPSLEIQFRRCARQRRGSLDCGVHMLMNMFASRLQQNPQDPDTIADRLRPFFAWTIKHHPRKEVFITIVLKELLRRKQEPVLVGGAAKRVAKKEVSSSSVKRTVRPTFEIKSKETKNNELPKTRREGKTRRTAGYYASRKRAAKRIHRKPMRASFKSTRSQGTNNQRRSQSNKPSSQETSHRYYKRDRLVNENGRDKRQKLTDSNDHKRLTEGLGVEEYVDKICTEAQEAERFIANKSLCYYLVATALLSVGEGVERSLKPDALAVNAGKKGFKASTQYDVGEALARFGLRLDFLVQDSPRKAMYLLPRPKEDKEERTQQALYVQGPIGRPLPVELESNVFKLGAKFIGNVTKIGARQGHYVLTKDPKEACIGVYLPKDMLHYTKDMHRRLENPTIKVDMATKESVVHPVELGAKRERSKKSSLTDEYIRYRPPPPGYYNPPPYTPMLTWNNRVQELALRDPLHPSSTATSSVNLPPQPPKYYVKNGTATFAKEIPSVEELLRRESELKNAQNAPTMMHLNANGKQTTEVLSCPRNWYIYPTKPPHVHNVTWDAVTPATRALHRRWLIELRSMPAELLHRPLASAAIELVNLMALRRNWKFSTKSKALAAIAGAMKNLPIYTNQTKGIDLNADPLWHAAVQTTHRSEREEIPEPPPAIDVESERAAEKILMKKNPTAALYLAMMWAFAARASDLATMKCQDIDTINLTRNKKTVKVNLTIRRGKGSKTRGPYPLSSTLTKEMGSQLVKLKASLPHPYYHLFWEIGKIRKQVLWALRQVDAKLALPSIRKGALRYWAENGWSAQQLMQMSGHKKLDTLLRYLGYGLHPTKEAVAAQDDVERLLLKRLRSEERRQTQSSSASTSTHYTRAYKNSVAEKNQKRFRPRRRGPSISKTQHRSTEKKEKE